MRLIVSDTKTFSSLAELLDIISERCATLAATLNPSANDKELAEDARNHFQNVMWEQQAAMQAEFIRVLTTYVAMARPTEWSIDCWDESGTFGIFMFGGGMPCSVILRPNGNTSGHS